VVERDDLFVNWADSPSVIRLADGSLAAHWLQRSGDESYAYDVRIARSMDGGQNWSMTVAPHDDETPTEHGFATLFPGTADGSVRAVWLDGRNYADPDADPPFMTLRHAEIAPDGTRSFEAVLDSRTCDCCQTSAAALKDDWIVAYRGRTSGEVRDIRVVRTMDGRWTEPKTVADDGWTISACPVNGPAIAARGDDVAVAWFTAASDSARVQLAFSSDGGRSFDTPIRVAGPGAIGRPLGRVDLALTGSGIALVSWLHDRDGSAALMLAALSSSGDRDMAVVESRIDGGRATGFPRLALDANGALLAWTQPGEPSRIRLVRVPLNSRGTEFRQRSSPKKLTMVRP
jgi:hypothetical protein